VGGRTKLSALSGEEKAQEHAGGDQAKPRALRAVRKELCSFSAFSLFLPLLRHQTPSPGGVGPLSRPSQSSSARSVVDVVNKLSHIATSEAAPRRAGSGHAHATATVSRANPPQVGPHTRWLGNPNAPHSARRQSAPGPMRGGACTQQLTMHHSSRCRARRRQTPALRPTPEAATRAHRRESLARGRETR
jgi:hypothetical protein